jgi:hypothetical protein
VSPLTSAECLAIAEHKMVEAMGDRRHGKELKLTAQAWMVLALRRLDRPRRLENRRNGSPFGLIRAKNSTLTPKILRDQNIRDPADGQRSYVNQGPLVPWQILWCCILRSVK